MNANFTKSLYPGSERKYVEAQAAPYPGNQVHIQVAGPQGNRNYGYAITINDAKFRDALENAVIKYEAAISLAHPDVAAPKSLPKSLAGTRRRYIPVQIAPYDDDEVHVQFSASNEINRDYGFALTFESLPLATYLLEDLDLEV